MHFSAKACAALIVSLVWQSQVAAGPVDCDKLIRSTQPFQMKRDLKYRDFKGPGEVVSLTQVYRSQGGHSVVLNAESNAVSKLITRYGIVQKGHSVEDGKSYHSNVDISGGAKDFFGSKADFTYDSAATSDRNNYKDQAKFSASYLGEDDVNVGVCFFHILKYRITKSVVRDGKPQDVNVKEMSYSPDLGVELETKFKVLAFDYSSEMHTTDISTDFLPIPDPGD